MRPLYKKDWVVYSKAPLGGRGAKTRSTYLVTRIASPSATNRLLKLEHGQVTLRFTDYAADRKRRVHDAVSREFLPRFVQRVLPRGFVKIRHYGLIANRQRADKLHDCRRLLLPLTAVVNASSMPRKDQPPTKLRSCLPNAQCVRRCGSCRLRRIELCNAASADLGENSSLGGAVTKAAVFLKPPRPGVRGAPVLLETLHHRLGTPAQHLRHPCKPLREPKRHCTPTHHA